MIVPQPPSNLIPSTISGLPTAPPETTAATSLLPIVFEGNTYKINADLIVSTTGVPLTRQIIAGTCLMGGGTLAADVTLSVAPSSIGYTQLVNSGVTAGTYGSSTMIPVFDVDEKGRLIGVTNTPLTVSGYVPITRQVIAGIGLTGGGALNANVTLTADLSDITPQSVYQFGSAGTATTLSRSDHKHPAVNLADSNQVSGVLPMAQGGTSKSLTPDEGGMIWSGADGLYIGPVGSNNQLLTSAGADEYTWTDQSLLNVGQADNLNGGAANKIAFQLAPDVTSFIPAPTEIDTVLYWTGAGFAWDQPPGTGTVTSVNMSVPTGFSISGAPITAAGTLVLGFTSGYSLPANSSQANWNTAYSERLQWDGGSTNLVAATGRTSLGLGTMATQNANNVSITGGSVALTGMLTLAASNSSFVPFRMIQGTTPTSPIDGDMWLDANGIYLKNISAIHQLDADANAVGALSNAVITDNGNGSINVSSIDVFIYAQAGWQGDYVRKTVPAASNLTLTDTSQNFLIVSYNSGSPIYSVTTVAASVNNSNVLLVATMWREGTQIHFEVVNWGLATATRLNDRLINIQRYTRSSGLMLSESATRIINTTSGLVWYGVKAYAEAAATSSPNNCVFYFHSGGNWTSSTVSTYNNSQYDNGTNLVTLTNNRYTINWIYQFIDGDALPKLAYHMSTAEYTSVALAAATTAPTPPPILSQMAILVGRIIVQKSASTASQIDSAFTTVFAGTTVTEHNNLSGLQGGTTNEYYHMTSAEYTGTGTGNFVRLNAPTFTGTPTIPSINMGLQSIATTGGTTTFTSATVDYTIFTGTQGQTLILPDATTLIAGRKFRVDNDSTQGIQVKRNGGADLWTIAPGCDLYLTCTSISTAAGGWESDYSSAKAASGKSLTISNSLTLTGTDNSAIAFGAGGTVLYVTSTISGGTF